MADVGKIDDHVFSSCPCGYSHQPGVIPGVIALFQRLDALAGVVRALVAIIL